MRYVALWLLVTLSPLSARPTWVDNPSAWQEPWGKDAGITLHQPKQEKKLSTIQKGATVAIKFHQNVISPCDGPRSHYAPSSSYYTLEAIQKYGFLKGFVMGCDRLMRENSDPWIYETVDYHTRTLKDNKVR